MKEPQRNTTWRVIVTGLLLFLGVDALIFRTGLYWRVVEPESNAGVIVREAIHVPDLHPPEQPPAVLVLGNSRLGEGCVPQILHEQLGIARDSLHVAAVPGSRLRIRALLYERIPRPRDGWQIVVQTMAHYDDDANAENFTDRELDLAFFGPLLDLVDMPELALEFTRFDLRRDAVLGALCKSYAMRRDLRAFLTGPLERIETARMHRSWMAGERIYSGRTDSLAGAHVRDGEVSGIEAVPELVALQLRQLAQMGPAHDNAAYRRRWLARLADAVQADGGQLVLARMPTQVLPRARPRPPNTVVIDELARREGVHVLDRDLFSELEDPGYFFDALHLNRAGAERFSAILASELKRRFADVLSK